MDELARRWSWRLVDLAGASFLLMTIWDLAMLVDAYARMPAWEMLGGALIEAATRVLVTLAVWALAYRFVQFADDLRVLRRQRGDLP